jgi:hypothetical protein
MAEKYVTDDPYNFRALTFGWAEADPQSNKVVASFL